MAERTLIQNRVLFGLVYVGLMCLLLLVNIIPLEVWPRGIPGPDLMVAITFVWLLRRPGHLPTPLVAAVFFIADILLMRPPGLWAALMVVATEILKTGQTGVQERAFVTEWALVSGILFAATLTNAAVLALTFFEQARLDIAIIQAISTLLAYPLIAVTARYVFGVTILTINDTDARALKG